MLADGTTYCRKSGEEVGANGRWHRWTTIKGMETDNPLHMSFCEAVCMVQ